MSALRLAPCMVAVLCVVAPVAAHASCPPRGHTRASLRALGAAGFEDVGDGERQALALALVDCLGSADPTLRDDVAFGALYAWSRAGALNPDTLRALLHRLQPELAPARADRAGFRQPFAALALAEVARADRLAPFLAPEERTGLVRAAATYLAGVRDYRGFEPGAGWRHGVAHGADLALQLAANPALARAELDALLDAIAVQVAPTHAYVFGEPERLARPVLAIAQRGVHPPEAWAAWLARVATVPGAPAAFKTREGLARRHNGQAFVRSLYVALQEGQDAALRERLLPAVRAVLR